MSVVPAMSVVPSKARSAPQPTDPREPTPGRVKVPTDGALATVARRAKHVAQGWVLACAKLWAPPWRVRGLPFLCHLSL